jgi:hypothetical protein
VNVADDAGSGDLGAGGQVGQKLSLIGDSGRDAMSRNWMVSELAVEELAGRLRQIRISKGSFSSMR